MTRATRVSAAAGAVANTASNATRATARSHSGTAEPPNVPTILSRGVAEGRQREVQADIRTSGCRSQIRAGSLRLEIGDLAVRPLLPGVEDVAVLLLALDHVSLAPDVTFLVEGDVAEHGVEGFAGVHDLGHLLWVERLRLLSGLLEDLHRRVAVERVGLRLEAALLAEQVDDRLVLRVGAWVGRERHEGAFGARAGNGRELVVRHAVAAHERRLQALVAHLPDDQAAGVV